MSYKVTVVTLSLICFAFCSLATFYKELQCLFNMPKTNLKISGYFKEGGVAVLKFIPRDQPDYEKNIEALPTFVVVGKDLGGVLKVVGEGVSPPYINLIKLPSPEAIIHISSASEVVRLKLFKRGWEILGVKSIRPGGAEGVAWFVALLKERRIVGL